MSLFLALAALLCVLVTGFTVWLVAREIERQAAEARQKFIDDRIALPIARYARIRDYSAFKYLSCEQRKELLRRELFAGRLGE